jgi:hypothetical protein
MNEFCAGVKILLERMKSNPEDFQQHDYDMATNNFIEGRFYDFAKLIGQVVYAGETERPWADWHCFTEEERQALIAGFKEMKRTQFDKNIMERVFDEQYSMERQREERRQKQQSIYAQKVHAAQVHAAQVQGQAHLAISAQQGGTGFSGGGLMNAMGLGNIFK